MKNLLLQIFTWWNGQTIGTRFFTWRKGERVGKDAAGNVYYRAPSKAPMKERRWVIYAGEAEASAIPPGWHGWMHYRTDEVPGDYQAREWELPHKENKTGTAEAYRPQGSLATAASRPQVTGDYDAWSPDN